MQPKWLAQVNNLASQIWRRRGLDHQTRGRWCRPSTRSRILEGSSSNVRRRRKFSDGNRAHSVRHLRDCSAYLVFNTTNKTFGELRQDLPDNAELFEEVERRPSRRSSAQYREAGGPRRAECAR